MPDDVVEVHTSPPPVVEVTAASPIEVQVATAGVRGPIGVQGPVGEKGDKGDQGDQGEIGPPLAKWQGAGPPPDVIVGAVPGDLYVDLTTGQLYQLT